MKTAIALLAAGLGFVGASAMAEPLANQAPGAAASSDRASEVQPVDPDEQVRRIRKTVVESGAAARNAGASTPFPYATAIDPPREPYRSPVACKPYARETDGSSTCIGIGEPAREAGIAPSRPAARARAPAEPRRQAIVRPADRPAKRLTDPRYDPAPLRLEPPPYSGNGFISFLGSVFSRN